MVRPSGGGGGGDDGAATPEVVSVEALPLPYHSLDVDGVIVDVNDRWLDVFGYDRSEVVEEEFGSFLTPESRSRFESRFEASKSSGEWADLSLEMRRGTGHAISVVHEGTVEYEDDEVVCIHSQLYPTDVERESGRETPQNRIVLSTLLENMPFGIVAEDGNRTVVVANQTVCELFDLTTECEDLIGSDAASVTEEVKHHFEQGEEFVDHAGDVLAKRERSVNQEWTTTDDRVIACSHIPYSLPDGEGSLWLYQDVTEQKRREQELRRKNERLDEFAAVVSHDLRNPLNVAQGRAALVNDDCESEHMDGLRDALARMEEIIEDTLVLAYQGETVGEKEWIDTTDLLNHCWEMISSTEADLEIQGTFQLHGERERLQHLFENLFRNAIEHGGENVTVTVGRIDENGLYVEDDGPGIPEAERADIFDPGHSTEIDGTGFGLTIVRRIAEAHGWEITVTDGEDGGARFEFEGVDIN